MAELEVDKLYEAREAIMDNLFELLSLRHAAPWTNWGDSISPGIENTSEIVNVAASLVKADAAFSESFEDLAPTQENE